MYFSPVIRSWSVNTCWLWFIGSATSGLHFCNIYELFFKDFIYLFVEMGEGREKERERNINVWLPLKRRLLGTCPVTQAWESKQQLFDSQAITQPTEPRQPGFYNFLMLDTSWSQEGRCGFRHWVYLQSREGVQVATPTYLPFIWEAKTFPEALQLMSLYTLLAKIISHGHLCLQGMLTK